MNSRQRGKFSGRAARLWLLALFTLAIIIAAFFLPRIPQSQAYHRFADQRTILGVPDFWNVVSNAPFLLVGALGLIFLKSEGISGGKSHFLEPRERWPYLVFFLGVALTSLGSAYYHLAPNDDRLVWDRLPMTLAFMSFVAAVMVERVSLKAGLWLLPMLLAAGIGAVILWHSSELRGHGDLRSYILVQAYPMLAIPLLTLLFPARYTRSADLLAVVGFYALAKVFELLDRPIFDLGGALSGHTLKHLAAALSAYWMLRMLRLRLLVATRG